MNDYYSEGSDGTVFSFNLVLDQSYHSIERKAFTLGDMFGMIGGMNSMLWIIAIIFVRIFLQKYICFLWFPIFTALNQFLNIILLSVSIRNTSTCWTWEDPIGYSLDPKS